MDGRAAYRFLTLRRLLAAAASVVVAALAAGGSVAAGPRCPGIPLGSVAFLRGSAVELLDLRTCASSTLVRSGATGPVRISHDGRWVAFGGGFVSASGGAVRRTSGAGTWSPTTDDLAVGTPRGGLELLRPGAGTRRLLPDGWGVLTLAFSPDGRTLAVSRSLYRYGTPWRTWHQEIWAIDVATGSRRLLFALGPKELAPAWLQGFSPDGRWILFWEDLENSSSLAADGLPLLALPAAGGHPITISRGELHYPDFLAWCGRSLVYVLNRGGRQVTLGDGVATASPPSWRSRTIVPAGGKTSWNSLACPAAAAAARGGGSLVVSAGPSTQDEPFGHEHRSLWLVSATDGSRERIVQADPPPGATDELPMWSGDGRWILFVRTKGGHGALYGIDPFGGNLVGPIADVGEAQSYYGHYDWSTVLDWHR